MGYAVKDTALKVTKALPNGAATLYSGGLDLGHGRKGDFLAGAEFKISAPALTTTQQPDAKTLAYTIQHDDAAAFGTVADLYPGVIVQLGAGGAGAAAATFTARLADCDLVNRFRCANEVAEAEGWGYQSEGFERGRHPPESRGGPADADTGRDLRPARGHAPVVARSRRGRRRGMGRHTLVGRASISASRLRVKAEAQGLASSYGGDARGRSREEALAG